MGPLYVNASDVGFYKGSLIGTCVCGQPMTGEYDSDLHDDDDREYIILKCVNCGSKSKGSIVHRCTFINQHYPGDKDGE